MDAELDLLRQKYVQISKENDQLIKEKEFLQKDVEALSEAEKKVQLHYQQYDQEMEAELDSLRQKYNQISNLNRKLLESQNVNALEDQEANTTLEAFPQETQTNELELKKEFLSQLQGTHKNLQELQKLQDLAENKAQHELKVVKDHDGILLTNTQNNQFVWCLLDDLGNLIAFAGKKNLPLQQVIWYGCNVRANWSVSKPEIQHSTEEEANMQVQVFENNHTKSQHIQFAKSRSDQQDDQQDEAGVVINQLSTDISEKMNHYQAEIDKHEIDQLDNKMIQEAQQGLEQETEALLEYVEDVQALLDKHDDIERNTEIITALESHAREKLANKEVVNSLFKEIMQRKKDNIQKGIDQRYKEALEEYNEFERRIPKYKFWQEEPWQDNLSKTQTPRGNSPPGLDLSQLQSENISKNSTIPGFEAGDEVALSRYLSPEMKHLRTSVRRSIRRRKQQEENEKALYKATEEAQRENGSENSTVSKPSSPYVRKSKPSTPYVSRMQRQGDRERKLAETESEYERLSRDSRR